MTQTAKITTQRDTALYWQIVPTDPAQRPALVRCDQGIWSCTCGKGGPSGCADIWVCQQALWTYGACGTAQAPATITHPQAARLLRDVIEQLRREGREV